MLAAGGLVAVACFQAALAAGAPLGHLAWGGAGGSGRLPTPLRAASGAAAIAWLAVARAVLAGHERTTRGAAWALLGGAAMNAASPSRAEARLWTPATLALAALLAAAGRAR